MIIITIVKKNLTVAKCPKMLNGTQMRRIFAGLKKIRVLPFKSASSVFYLRTGDHAHKHC